MKKSFLLIFIVGIFLGLIIGFFMNNFLEKYTGTKNTEDNSFYSYADIYLNTLNDDDYNYIIDFSNSFANTDEYKSFSYRTYLDGFSLMDERFKNIIEELRKTVIERNNKQASKEKADDLFNKNNTCAILINDIKEELSNKYSNNSLIVDKEKEELDFIFYSSAYNACLYSTSYDYEYSGYGDNYSNSSKRIYNASNNTLIQEYITYYSYNYPNLTNREITDKESINRKHYYEFILTNSDYDINLISSYF